MINFIIWLLCLPSLILSASNPNIESESDRLLKILLGPQFDYNSSSLEIQSEIQSIHKYLTYSNSIVDFTPEIFYEMIKCRNRNEESDFHCLNDFKISNLIKIDNEMKIKDKINFLFKWDLFIHDPFLPHYPELSLELFKSQNDSLKRKILVNNALSSPLLFHKFFKYLSKEFFKVSRDDLVAVMNEVYPSNLIYFEKYQVIHSVVHVFLATERILIILLFSFISYNFQSNPMNIFVFFSYLVILSFLSKIFFYLISENNYLNFVDITDSEINRALFYKSFPEDISKAINWIRQDVKDFSDAITNSLLKSYSYYSDSKHYEDDFIIDDGF